MEVEYGSNNESLQETLPDAIMLLGKGNPYRDEENMRALKSMAGSAALLWLLSPDSRKPYIFSTAANIEKGDNAESQEYSKILSSVLLNLGVDPQYFIFRDWAFETNIELRLLRRLYLSRFQNGDGSRVQIVAFHNKERVKKLLSFFRNQGKEIEGDVRVYKPREIFDEYQNTEKFKDISQDLRDKIALYISSGEDDIKAERNYELLDMGERVFSILGRYSIFYPNNRTYIASLRRRVRIPYNSTVDNVCRDHQKRIYGRKILNVASRLAKR
ncbi:MAG: hypothetical protein ACYDAS_03620 [Patescibacteria group bacterium]